MAIAIKVGVHMGMVSPGLPTENNQEGYNPVYDNSTESLREQLNAVVDQIPTSRLTQRAYIRDNSGPGVGDENYNVGFHMLPVDNQVSMLPSRFEAPNVPVTQLPFAQALFNSTQVQPQTLNISSGAMRAPGINEGY